MVNKKIIQVVGILIVLTCFVLSVPFVHAVTLSKTIEKAEDFISGGEIIMVTKNGFIRIHSWQKEKVNVSSEVKVRGATEEIADDLLKEIELNVERNGSTLRINLDIPPLDEFSSGGWLNWIFGGRRPQVSANITVHVPFSSSVDAQSTNGNVTVDSLRGDARLKTTNGKIETGPIFGDAVLKSTNGLIAVREAAGEIDAHTTNGGIKILMNREGAANHKIECHTTNGGIDLEIPKPLKCDINARTTNGSITVKLLEILNADVFLATSNGTIQTDFPLLIEGVISKRKLEGTIGEGGKEIRLKTTNGKITLKKIE